MLDHQEESVNDVLEVCTCGSRVARGVAWVLLDHLVYSPYRIVGNLFEHGRCASSLWGAGDKKGFETNPVAANVAFLIQVPCHTPLIAWFEIRKVNVDYLPF